MILESRRQYTQSLTRPPATIRYTGGINTTKSLRRDFSKMVKDRNLRFSPFKITSKGELKSRRAIKSDDYKLVKKDIENKYFGNDQKSTFRISAKLNYETSTERKLIEIILNWRYNFSLVTLERKIDMLFSVEISIRNGAKTAIFGPKTAFSACALRLLNE